MVILAGVGEGGARGGREEAGKTGLFPAS